jgi:hypothetical protein
MQKTTLAPYQDLADKAAQNAEEAVIEIVRQKVLATPELVAGILVHLPPMTKHVLGKALASKAAKAAATEVVRQKVFAVPELVENILVHLPPKTIFGVKRVCKGFANALDKSVEIQEKLFLCQRVKSKESVAHEVLHGGDELNPFFAIDRALATDEGISMRDAVLISFESSLLRTYLCDFPCEDIHLDFDLHAGKGRSISFDCWVHDDDGGTISDIPKRAVFEQWGDLRVKGHQMETGMWLNHSPTTILRRWAREDSFQPDMYVWLGHRSAIQFMTRRTPGSSPHH